MTPLERFYQHAQEFPPVKINFASVNVTGGPGLGLVVIVVAMAFEFPEVQWLLLSGLAGGVFVAIALVVLHRRWPVVPKLQFPSLRNGHAHS